MLGLKRFGNTAVTIGGIELAHKIKKGQFDTSELRLEGARVLRQAAKQGRADAQQVMGALPIKSREC